MTSPLVGARGRHKTDAAISGTVVHVDPGDPSNHSDVYVLLDTPEDDGTVFKCITIYDFLPTDPEALRKRLGTSPARELGTAFAERLLDGMSPREIVAKVAEALTGSEESWRKMLRQVGYRVGDVVRDGK
jgi:hypothetical protein